MKSLKNELEILSTAEPPFTEIANSFEMLEETNFLFEFIKQFH